jgi:hypothetical protein
VVFKTVEKSLYARPAFTTLAAWMAATAPSAAAVTICRTCLVRVSPAANMPRILVAQPTGDDIARLIQGERLEKTALSF